MDLTVTVNLNVTLILNKIFTETINIIVTTTIIEKSECLNMGVTIAININVTVTLSIGL